MYAEDVDVWIFGDAFLDVGVEFDGELFASFGGFGRVHHFCTLGFGHCERRVSWCGMQREFLKLQILIYLFGLELFYIL